MENEIKVNSAEIEVENDITQEQPKDENGSPMRPPQGGPKRR